MPPLIITKVKKDTKYFNFLSLSVSIAWYSCNMVAHNTLRTCKTSAVRKINLTFDSAVDVNHCLQQIKFNDCASHFGLPSNITTLAGGSMPPNKLSENIANSR